MNKQTNALDRTLYMMDKGFIVVCGCCYFSRSKMFYRIRLLQSANALSERESHMHMALHIFHRFHLILCSPLYPQNQLFFSVATNHSHRQFFAAKQQLFHTVLYCCNSFCFVFRSNLTMLPQWTPPSLLLLLLLIYFLKGGIVFGNHRLDRVLVWRRAVTKNELFITFLCKLCYSSIL